MKIMRSTLVALALTLAGGMAARAADPLNVYTIWPGLGGSELQVSTTDHTRTKGLVPGQSATVMFHPEALHVLA